MADNNRTASADTAGVCGGKEQTMSRYIDADFEIAHYTSMTTNPTPDVTEQDKRNSLIILNALRMAKSIDIVRCKECKHNYNTCINHGKMQPRCDFTDRVLTENDYCSRGEREGE